MDYGFTSLQGSNSFNASPGSAFETNYSYDLNGNITNLNRKNATTQFDALTYSYLEFSNTTNNSFENHNPLNGVPVCLNVGNHYTNRLGSIDDTQSVSTETTDIDDQAEYNYTYDEIGQLNADSQEEIAEIVWNVTGKVLKIVRTSASSKPDLMFQYDAMGNRIVKIVIGKIPSQTPGEFEPQSQDEWDYTFYSRDASGNVMAVYSKSFSSCTNEDFSFVESLDLTELHIYGGSRLEMRYGKGNTISNCLNSSGAPAGIQVAGVTYEVMTGMSYSSIDEEVTSELNQDTNAPCSTYFTLIEYKTFELSDHLGNVSATISDRKISVWNTNQDAVVSYNPDVLSQQDYYPFGMGMIGRAVTIDNYRYSFNTQEKEKEITGSESHTSAEHWMYDSRLGRRWEIDPVKKHHESPYAILAGNPIWFVDPLGADSALAADSKTWMWDVEKGDTYSAISKRTGVSVKNLMAWNKYEAKKIPVGALLNISDPSVNVTSNPKVELESCSLEILTFYHAQLGGEGFIGPMLIIEGTTDSSVDQLQWLQTYETNDPIESLEEAFTKSRPLNPDFHVDASMSANTYPFYWNKKPDYGSNADFGFFDVPRRTPNQQGTVYWKGNLSLLQQTYDGYIALVTFSWGFEVHKDGSTTTYLIKLTDTTTEFHKQVIESLKCKD